MVRTLPSSPARRTSASRAGGTATGGRSSDTGLPPRLAAALAYSGGLVTGLFFLAVERRDRYVRFHAAQSALVLGFCWFLGAFAWAAALASTLTADAAAAGFGRYAMMAWTVLAFLTLVGVGVAAAGKQWTLPFLGAAVAWMASTRRRPSSR